MRAYSLLIPSPRSFFFISLPTMSGKGDMEPSSPPPHASPKYLFRIDDGLLLPC